MTQVFFIPGSSSERRPLVFTGEEPSLDVADTACPHCSQPLSVVGDKLEATEVGDREWHSPAHCAACSRPVGTIIVQPVTFFGIEEDRAVLYGRPRVY